MIIGWQCDNLRLRHLDCNPFVLFLLFCHHAQPLLLLLIQSILFRSTFLCAVGEWKRESFPHVAVYMVTNASNTMLFLKRHDWSFKGEKKRKKGHVGTDERMSVGWHLTEGLPYLSLALEKSAVCLWFATIYDLEYVDICSEKT